MLISYGKFLNEGKKNWIGFKLVKRLKGNLEKIVGRKYYDSREKAEEALRDYFMTKVRKRYGLTDKGITGIMNQNIGDTLDKGKAMFISGYLVYPLYSKD